MGRAAVVLIWALLVMVVIAILLSSFFLTTMTENSLAKRYVASVRAFWAAETGISEAIVAMPNSTSGTIGGSNYSYTTTTTLIAADYYRVDSIGAAVVPSGGFVERKLSSVVKTTPVDTNNFQHAIRTTVELDVQGSVDINGTTEENAALDFPDLFDSSKEEIEAYAAHVYTDPVNNITPVDTITWINLSEGQEFRINDNGWTGGGILVVEGNAMITGGTFDGVLYVIGDLRISGNPTISGTVLVESDTELVEDTDITGNVTINYDTDAIANALVALQFISPEVVSWREQ